MNHWQHLLRLAQDEVSRTLHALPQTLQNRAASLPISYESHPSQALQDDGFEPDLLGLFVGAPIGEPDSCPLPAQILLFLENIWEFSGEDEAIYREEIRTTYLHELGHYLGLDELDMEERGLD